MNRGHAEDSAADAAGILAGDIIYTFDGVPIDDDDHLVNQVKLTPVGKQVPVMVLRDGSSLMLKATLRAQ